MFGQSILFALLVACVFAQDTSRNRNSQQTPRSGFYLDAWRYPESRYQPDTMRDNRDLHNLDTEKILRDSQSGRGIQRGMGSALRGSSMSSGLDFSRFGSMIGSTSPQRLGNGDEPFSMNTNRMMPSRDLSTLNRRLISLGRSVRGVSSLGEMSGFSRPLFSNEYPLSRRPDEFPYLRPERNYPDFSSMTLRGSNFMDSRRGFDQFDINRGLSGHDYGGLDMSLWNRQDNDIMNTIENNARDRSMDEQNRLSMDRNNDWNSRKSFVSARRDSTREIGMSGQNRMGMDSLNGQRDMSDGLFDQPGNMDSSRFMGGMSGSRRSMQPDDHVIIMFRNQQNRGLQRDRPERRSLFPSTSGRIPYFSSDQSNPLSGVGSTTLDMTSNFGRSSLTSSLREPYLGLRSTAGDMTSNLGSVTRLSPTLDRMPLTSTLDRDADFGRMSTTRGMASNIGSTAGGMNSNQGRMARLSSTLDGMPLTSTLNDDAYVRQMSHLTSLGDMQVRPTPSPLTSFFNRGSQGLTTSQSGSGMSSGPNYDTMYQSSTSTSKTGGSQSQGSQGLTTSQSGSGMSIGPPYESMYTASSRSSTTTP